MRRSIQNNPVRLTARAPLPARLGETPSRSKDEKGRVDQESGGSGNWGSFASSVLGDERPRRLMTHWYDLQPMRGYMR